MTDLVEKLEAHRRRIRIARASDAAARGAFYASLAVCGALAVAKIAGWILPVPALVVALVAPPLVLAVREAIRRFSILDCAVHLDRMLGLEERLSTAVELSGSMGGALAADARQALARATLPRHRLPREARLLGGSGLLLVALLLVPAPNVSGAAADPGTQDVIEQEIARLGALADLNPRIKKAIELLEKKDPEGALSQITQAEQEMLEQLLEGKGDSGGDTRDAIDELGESAAAIGAALGRLGRPIHAPPPIEVRMKLKRQPVTAPPETGSEDARPTSPLLEKLRLEKGDWHPRYDLVINRYFDKDKP